MGTLGSFGTDRPALDETFSYFGSVVRVHPDFTDLAITDVFAEMKTALPADKSEEEQAAAAVHAAGGMRRIIETLVHPDDVADFWSLTRSHRQTNEDLSDLCRGVIAALADRPTQLPSDSSDGQRPTVMRSAAGSSSAALEVLEGRPDLQVAVVRRVQEARSA